MKKSINHVQRAIDEGLIKSKTLVETKGNPKKVDGKWIVRRYRNQRKAFEFLTSLMILESSIRVNDNGEVWFFLMSLLEENCLDSQNGSMHAEIRDYIEEEIKHDTEYKRKVGVKSSAWVKVDGKNNKKKHIHEEED